MSGGDGNPPGERGCRTSIATQIGTGGQGLSAGENGELLGLQAPLDYCGEDGQLSGDGLTCNDSTDNDSSGGPCWYQYGSTYSAYYEISNISTSTIDGSISTYFESWAENGMLVRPQYGGWAWERQGIYIKRITRPFGGNVDTTYSYNPDIYVNGGYALSITWGPRCFGSEGYYCLGGDNFQLYLPGSNFEHTCEGFSQGQTFTVTYKLQFTGCNNNPELRDYTGGWRCCKDKAIKDDEECP
jgi:hypothetical protein